MLRSPLVAFQWPLTRDDSLTRAPRRGRTPACFAHWISSGSSAGVSTTKKIR